jgi:hypothetical protein
METYVCFDERRDNYRRYAAYLVMADGTVVLDYLRETRTTYHSEKTDAIIDQSDHKLFFRMRGFEHSLPEYVACMLHEHPEVLERVRGKYPDAKI